MWHALEEAYIQQWIKSGLGYYYDDIELRSKPPRVVNACNFILAAVLSNCYMKSMMGMPQKELIRNFVSE